MIPLSGLEQECGGCPSSWRAKTVEGTDVFIRYRYGTLTVSIDGINCLTLEHGDSLDGVLSTDEMLRITGFTIVERRN